MARTVRLLALCIAAPFAVAGCGSEENSVGGGLPTISAQANGVGTASAPDRTAAQHWCTLLRNGEGTTPDGKGRLPAGVEQVRFRLHNTREDVICRLP